MPVFNLQVKPKCTHLPRNLQIIVSRQLQYPATKIITGEKSSIIDYLCMRFAYVFNPYVFQLIYYYLYAF